MNKRVISIFLALALLLGTAGGLTPGASAASEPPAASAEAAELQPETEGRDVFYVDPEYGVFYESEGGYDDTVSAEAVQNVGGVPAWAVRNNLWLDMVEQTGYPVQKLYDAGLLYNPNTTNWYKNYTYRSWKGMGLNENKWTLEARSPKNYAEAVSAWSATNVENSLVYMASVASAGGTAGLYYKGYSASTVSYGSHTSGAGVAYGSNSKAVMEKPEDWKAQYVKTTQGNVVQRGIVCASLVNYAYFNDLPTRLGFSMLNIGNNWHYRKVDAPKTLGGLLLPNGAYGSDTVVSYNNTVCMDIGFSDKSWKPYVDTVSCSTQAQMLAAIEDADPGAILLFKYGKVVNGKFTSLGAPAHTAIYLGYWNNTHWMFHTASVRGPEIQSIDTALVREEPPLLYKLVTPPPYLRVTVQAERADYVANIPVTVNYKNPGGTTKTWTAKTVARKDRAGKTYGEVLMPMCLLQENAWVKVSLGASGLSFPDGTTAEIAAVHHGENLVEFCGRRDAEAQITVTGDISAQTYRIRLHRTDAAGDLYGFSDRRGNVHWTDGAQSAADLGTTFSLPEGVWTLTEFAMGRFSPVAVRITATSPAGQKTVLADWNIFNMTENGLGSGSFTSPTFSTVGLALGSTLRIEVTNGLPVVESGSLTGRSGEHETACYSTVRLTDRIHCTRLIPGHVYAMRCVLVDAETGVRIQEKGADIISESANQTAQSDTADFHVAFILDTSALGGRKIAVQEYLLDRTLPACIAHWLELTDPARQVLVNPELDFENPYEDVPDSAWFAEAVLWATRAGYATGTSRTRFSPNAGCSRAQAVTFLWRVLGRPVPEPGEMPFTDVLPGKWYSDPVLWAWQNGYIKGRTETCFSPHRDISRAEFLTVLWRAHGCPAPASEEMPFEDVPEDTWYTDGVRWAAEQGIAAGVTPTRFNPQAVCTRAQIVTFLRRMCEASAET